MQRGRLPGSGIASAADGQTSGTVPLSQRKVCWAVGLTWAVAFATVSPAPLPLQLPVATWAGDCAEPGWGGADSEYAR